MGVRVGTGGSRPRCVAGSVMRVGGAPGVAGTAGTAGMVGEAGGWQARQADMAGTADGSSGATFHLPRETLYPFYFTDTYVDLTTDQY